MPKEVVVTGLGNRIEYATTDGRGLITGKREDITDVAINAVHEHMKQKFKRSGTAFKEFGFRYADGSKLVYVPAEGEEKE